MKSPKTEPRYLWLRSLLERDIQEGKYKVGATLPKEEDLATTYKVSRHTVREALRGLVTIGLIERYPRRGTIVTAQYPVRPSKKFEHGVTNENELLQYTAQTRLSILLRTQGKLTYEEAQNIGVKRNSIWTKFIGSRWMTQSELPIGFSFLYVRPEFEGIMAAVEEGGGSIYELLNTMYGAQVKKVWQRIEAKMMPESAPFVFRNDIGAPALRLLRAYCDEQGRVLSFSDTYYLSDRFQFFSEWEH